MKIRLRELKMEDAPLMLEWMHDKDIQKSFKKNMLGATLEQAEQFCKDAMIPEKINSGDSIHFAIADEDDEYLGTISLKNFDIESLNAEYSIATRKKANGVGIAFEASRLLLDRAFNDYGLHRVYLNVFSDNIPAIRLYEKCGFKYEGEFREHIKIGGEYMNWKWYGMLKEDFDKHNREM